MTEATYTKHISGPGPRKEDRPDPDWVRGACPACGSDVVSNVYYCGGRGYLVIWECWESLGEDHERTCDYRRVI